MYQQVLNLIRWDKPIGTWLLFIPCSWSILLASSVHPVEPMRILYLLALFFLGAFIMRSAGCIVNDMWDRELDAKVERTRERPLASGALALRQAFLLLILLLLMALLIVVQLPLGVFWLAVMALPLVALYPLMKRITFWPQAFLGMTFNFGALMGWMAVTETLHPNSWLLYGAGIFWTLAYDTIYAFQDKKDDMAVGIKSTAVYFQHYPKKVVGIFYMISICFYSLALTLAGADIKALGLIVMVNLWIIYRLTRWRPEDPASCRNYFKSSHLEGFSLLIPIFLNYLS
jgi:4-hydroxybenzoate polyprenyltransferase